ncbi:MAG: hypothetical protein ACE5J7_04450 [Candidatus Aenigmatarchaeota archaeon]
MGKKEVDRMRDDLVIFCKGSLDLNPADELRTFYPQFDEVCRSDNGEECPIEDYRKRGQYGSSRYYCDFEFMRARNVREAYELMKKWKEEQEERKKFLEQFKD